MDHPGKNNGKDKIKNYFIYSESETEDYEISLKKQKANPNINKSLLGKKRHSKEKEQKKKNPFLKREITEIDEKRKYINTDKKIYENPFELQNLNNQNERMRYLEETVQKLTEQNSIFKHQLEQLKIESAIFQQKLEYQNFKLEEQKLAQKRLEIDNFRLQKSFNEIISTENNLLIEVNSLKDQVKELNEFHFQAKLRKLVKKLIEFLFDEFYPDYMSYNIITKKIKFYRFPLLCFVYKWNDEMKIIDSLNDLLDKIFVKSKKNNNIFHFVAPRTEKDEKFRRYIWVFKDDYDFFEYFGINEIDRCILLKIIPREYFMNIDNFQFDKSIKELISNF